MLLNLGRNAVQVLRQATAARARLQFDLPRRDGATVVIDVADDGPGVPEKARARLFEAFQSSTRQGGTGLGLAIAAELVRGHGGTIVLVPSEKGALFRIVLPDAAGL